MWEEHLWRRQGKVKVTGSSQNLAGGSGSSSFIRMEDDTGRGGDGGERGRGRGGGGGRGVGDGDYPNDCHWQTWWRNNMTGSV